MTMNKYILLVSLCICPIFAQIQGTPSTMKIATFAIDSYENTWLKDWPRGIAAANSFYDNMQWQILSKYPSTSISRLKKENNTAKKSTFLSNETENYNFIYYHGHGNNNKIFWGENEYVTNMTKSFGSGNTYWVMLVSCLVFQNGHSNQDPWFNGVHSILGFSSLAWTFRYSNQCGFLWLNTCVEKSEEMEKEFAVRWIKNGEKIWDAYKMAVYHQIYEDGGIGVEPKIVYRYGYINGTFFDPWEEKYAEAYLGPIFKTNYTGIGSRWSTMGSPTYQ